MRVLATIRRLGLRMKRKPARLFVTVMLLVLIGAMLFGVRYAAIALPLPPSIPYLVASGGGCFRCRCHNAAIDTVEALVVLEHTATRSHISIEFEQHRFEFVVDYWFRNYVLSAMMRATQQTTAVAMQQMQIFGTFLDAKEQLETQRTMEMLRAEAHRDYHPDVQMCTFGTMSRSLAATQRRGTQSAHVISQRFLDRQLNSGNTNAGEGKYEDREGRMDQFVRHFCGERDNNFVTTRAESGLTTICESSVAVSQINRDINYANLVDSQLTINASFTNAGFLGHEGDERAIVEMASNLYGHDVTDPPTPSLLRIPANQTLYLQSRALAAKRSVAQNSFATIVGMKTLGSTVGEESRGYMGVILQQMGVTDTDEITRYMGLRPSYHAQMEVLTKALYQRPEFYTNLYTSEANISRAMASMRAIGLMQDFDMFKSRLRNESMLSVLVELELEAEQTSVQDVMGGMTNTGARN